MSSNPLFLLGAGFNVDANVFETKLVGERVAYPTLVELLKDCFGLKALPGGQSIEGMFETAYRENNHSPLKRLVYVLRRADYHIVPRLRSSVNGPGSEYAGFFKRYARSNFLTFNYDGLCEAMLLHLGRWAPQSGYGVDVDISASAKAPRIDNGSLVVHLHGSINIDTALFSSSATALGNARIEHMVLSEKPSHRFDPDSADWIFPYYSRSRDACWQNSDERIIPPVPDKAPLLARPFVEAMYSRAGLLIASAPILVAIGYSFGEHDRCSYAPLLEAAQAANVSLLVVDPNGDAIRKRLLRTYPELCIDACPCGFSTWVRSGYPGLEDR
jgi:hypothetical protein